MSSRPVPFQIEQRVPIPSRQQTSKVRAALAALCVGESFWSPMKPHWSYVRDLRPRRFARRRVDGGWRMWRLE